MQATPGVIYVGKTPIVGNRSDKWVFRRVFPNASSLAVNAIQHVPVHIAKEKALQYVRCVSLAGLHQKIHGFGTCATNRRVNGTPNCVAAGLAISITLVDSGAQYAWHKDNSGCI